MADFPITQAPHPSFYSQSYYKRQNKTEMESGVVQSAAAATLGKRKFKTGWINLTSTLLAALEAFFETYQGSTFNWTHPDTTVYVVRFSSDELPEAKFAGMDGSEMLWKVGPIMLEQA